MRISATDWADGGWDVEWVCRPVKAAQRTRRGPDCRLSSGGTVQDAKIPVAKGDQLPFAQRIREEADERTIA